MVGWLVCRGDRIRCSYVQKKKYHHSLYTYIVYIIYPSTYHLSINTSMYPSIHPSIYLLVHPFIDTSTHSFIYLPIYLSNHIIHSFIYLSTGRLTSHNDSVCLLRCTDSFLLSGDCSGTLNLSRIIIYHHHYHLYHHHLYHHHLYHHHL